MHDMSLERTSLDEVLSSLGALLASRREAYGLLVVGGSNLLLLGLIDRPTGDLDVIGLSEQSAYRKVVELPEPLRRAAAEVGLAFDLSERWLNADAASLMDSELPPGWRERIEIRRYGALELHLTSRFDQICFKLWAAVDAGPKSKHFADLVGMSPTDAELAVAAGWTADRDISDAFPTLIAQCVNAVKGAIRDGDR
jgi:hypothetical protein